MHNITLPKETLGRLLLLAFRRGAAYGADGINANPGTTQAEAVAELFCDAIPGFEESGDLDRVKDNAARELLALLPDAPPEPWANLDKSDRDTIMLALTALANYAKAEQESPLGPSYRAAMIKAEAETLATLRKLDPEAKS